MYINIIVILNDSKGVVFFIFKDNNFNTSLRINYGIISCLIIDH